MPTKTNKPLRYRQIHLDFHTSEHIPGIGAAFDANDFVATLKRSHVDSITIFAKCHHGWSYYPTKVGKPHPHLSRPDLLGDMVSALGAADIECPIYISVQWDELSAREHPEWRVVSATNRYQHALPADPSERQEPESRLAHDLSQSSLLIGSMSSTRRARSRAATRRRACSSTSS